MAAHPIEERLNTLLSEREWLAGLARALVGDCAAADDLTQDTWVTTLRYRRPLASPRAFLATVLRNRARATARSEGRRRDRERGAAPQDDQGAPETSEVVERFETQRVVATAVAELDEPFRTTLLQHYYEGMSLADIARATDTPQGTVRWRLHRGHRMVRAKLEKKLGADKWRAALLPLCAFRPAVASASAVPVIAAAVLLAAVGLFVGGQMLGWFGADQEPAAPVRVAQAAGGTKGESAQDGPATREPVAKGPETESPQPDAKEEPLTEQHATVRARFLDEAAAPVRGVKLQVVGAELGGGFSTDSRMARMLPGATSGADGRAVLPLRAGVELLQQIHPSWRPASGAVWTLILEATGRKHATERFEVQIAHGDDRDVGDIRLRLSGQVRGKVVDANGKGIPGAEVALTFPPFPADCDRLARSAYWPHSRNRAKTGGWLAPGSFALRRVPRGIAMVWARLSGHKTAFRLVDVAAEPVEVRLQLVRHEPDAPGTTNELLTVTVVDPSGKPVPRAEVYAQTSAGSSMGITNEEGVIEVGFFRAKGDRTIAVGALDQARKWGPVHVADHDITKREVQLTLAKPRMFELDVRSSDGTRVRTFKANWRAMSSGLGRVWADGEAGVARLPVPASLATLEVKAPGHAEYSAPLGAPSALPARLEITLAPRAGLRGRVMAAGEPVAGAEIFALTPVANGTFLVNGFRSLYSRVTRTETSEDGRFRFDVEKPMRLRLQVRVRGFATGYTGDFDFDPKRGRDGIEIELAPGGAIEGTVFDRNRRPVPRAIVAINDHRGGARTVVADMSGRYRFADLADGGYEVCPSSQRLRPFGSLSRSGGKARPFTRFTNVEIANGETERFDLVLESCRIEGHLQVSGSSCRGWTARLYTRHDQRRIASTRIAADGRFELATFAAGDYRLKITTAGGPLGLVTFESDVTLREGDQPLRHVLAFGKLSGQAPVLQEARVWELRWERDGLRAVVPVHPEADGEFTAPLVPAGTVQLHAGGRKPVGVFTVR